MNSHITEVEIDRVATALDGAPGAAYTTPIVYPWALQSFAPRPCAVRPRPPAQTLRLYVHVPFCRYHCTFCFYAVRTGAQRPEMQRYVAALARELEWFAPGTSLSRLVIGGGTPTALPPELLDQLLTSIYARVPASAEHVSTIEASPDSITEAHLRVLVRHGVQRISMGLESLDDEVLEAVHRRHSAAQALEACRMIVASGLTLNVDLIYGLPGQSEASFRHDLDAVSQTGVHSLCLYALRLNERTPVASQLAAGEHLDLAQLMRWRAAVRRATGEIGFAQTRSYTFKRAEGGASWHERVTPAEIAGASDELGIGMSARSQLQSAVYRNHERADLYVQRVEAGESPVESVFELDEGDRKTQFIAASLGNGRALRRPAYASRFGVSIDEDFAALLERLSRAELIDNDGDHIALTETGMLVYDRILLCFFSERATSLLRDRPPARRRPGTPVS